MKIRLMLQLPLAKATISRIIGHHQRTVSCWQHRFEAGDDINDRARSGRPCSIPAEVTARIISFYCQHNPLPGCSRWSLRWAHRYLEKYPRILQCSVSRSSLNRFLNAHALKPHRRKYFLQISDPFFFEKMEHIIEVYKSNYSNLFCFDECTGLQALQRIAPALPAGSGHPAYHEPEYIRHGAVSILSVLNVHKGDVFTECIPDHTSPVILSCIKKHAEQFGTSEQLHYICDNYSSHSTELFCLGIADLCNIKLSNLKTVGLRKQWLQATDKRIVFHFLPSHGSWLNMIEIWFGILQQKAIKDESFSSKSSLCDRILDFTETWNLHFAHPFKWTYTGEQLHEKVIARFTRWLQMESPQMTPKFLEKQLLLMQNLAHSYWPKVKTDVWSFLEETLRQKQQFLGKIIEPSPLHNSLLANLLNSLGENLKAN
ncbi:MAG: IS630 family transposase [Deltaproteobacteria bacterium]|nr:IS630 family transposase [Deltaproteobacteria bacterium]